MTLHRPHPRLSYRRLDGKRTWCALTPDRIKAQYVLGPVHWLHVVLSFGARGEVHVLVTKVGNDVHAVEIGALGWDDFQNAARALGMRRYEGDGQAVLV